MTGWDSRRQSSDDRNQQRKEGPMGGKDRGRRRSYAEDKQGKCKRSDVGGRRSQREVTRDQWTGVRGQQGQRANGKAVR